MLKQLLFVALALVSTNLYAQKMNVLDYFKAFTSNTKSPNSQMIKMSPQFKEENGKYYFINEVRKNELIVNQSKSYLTYKDSEGWNGGKCYPTFKVYTKANGQQVLGVTEDAYTHNSYKSKYRPAQAPTRQIIREGKEICPQHQWNQRPKPIKFWTYEGGNWTEVTDEVMSEFFTLEQLIAKTTATPDAGMTLSEHMKTHINYQFYPLYRIEADKDEITVWVDEARLRLFTTEVEEFANPADNLHSRRTGRSKELFNFIENTTYKSYTLVWDAKAGQFVRKK
jgi:hypothetical protein